MNMKIRNGISGLTFAIIASIALVGGASAKTLSTGGVFAGSAQSIGTCVAVNASNYNIRKVVITIHDFSGMITATSACGPVLAGSSSMCSVEDNALANTGLYSCKVTTPENTADLRANFILRDSAGTTLTSTPLQ